MSGNGTAKRFRLSLFENEPKDSIDVETNERTNKNIVTVNSMAMFPWVSFEDRCDVRI
jgi:hypothetical protein